MVGLGDSTRGKSFDDGTVRRSGYVREKKKKRGKGGKHNNHVLAKRVSMMKHINQYVTIAD